MQLAAQLTCPSLFDSDPIVIDPGGYGPPPYTVKISDEDSGEELGHVSSSMAPIVSVLKGNCKIVMILKHCTTNDVCVNVQLRHLMENRAVHVWGRVAEDHARTCTLAAEAAAVCVRRWLLHAPTLLLWTSDTPAVHRVAIPGKGASTDLSLT